MRTLRILIARLTGLVLRFEGRSNHFPPRNSALLRFPALPLNRDHFRDGPSAHRLSPNLRRRVDDPVELAPHLLFAHHFRVNAAETALRAQS